MRLLTLIFLLVSASFSQTPAVEPGVSQELARWRAARYSDVRYEIGLNLEKMSPVLRGTIEVRVVLRDAATAGRPDPTIVLDWRKIRGYEDRSTISNVSINAKQVRVTPSGVSAHRLRPMQIFNSSRPRLFTRKRVTLTFEAARRRCSL